MKISLNWLRNYIDLSSISSEEIVKKLTESGLEVDSVEDQEKAFENIVVGLVKDKRSHPNADKLSICIVDDGFEELQVICGAPNVEKNQKIAFAKVGAVIPESGLKIKRTKIRNEISNGMICSERELGISENHDGIIVFDSSVKVGLPLGDFLGYNDVILDIDITPNRADAFSHIGIARELAAILNRTVVLPDFDINEVNEKVEEFASVIIENEIDCPRYVAKVVKDVTIKESPAWLKVRLKNIGLRPINNVVDVTNFVLHELGQPLHAFDLDKLSNSKIVVKSADENSNFVTLDSKERKLSSTDLMICDGEKYVAIAGVMGGENSEVTESTKNVLIESAYFRPSAVRKTSKRLGLSTDASTRFERGCNPEITVFAAKRAARLIAELGDGKLLKGEIDVYPNKIVKSKVDLRFNRIEKILGYKIPANEVVSILKKLEFDIISSNDESVLLTIPLFRPDVEREIDLIEEVARVYGYDKIPDVSKITVTLEQKRDESEFIDTVRNKLSSLGLNEIISNSLLREDLAFEFGNAVKVLSPQSTEMSHLRTSLLAGTLITISKNLKVKERNLRFFEIGHVFELRGTEIKSFDDFSETEHGLISLTGKAVETEWYVKDRLFDIYDLKGLVEDFFIGFNFRENIKYELNAPAHKHFENYFSVLIGEAFIGQGGKLNSSLLQKFDINQDVFVFDFDFSTLRTIEMNKKKFSELLKYPKVIRDFAFILDKSIECGFVIDAIYQGSSKLLKKVKLFDIFESESLGKGKKSLAFQLEYYDFSRTLTEEEVDKDFWKAIEVVKTKFNAQLRG